MKLSAIVSVALAAALVSVALAYPTLEYHGAQVLRVQFSSAEQVDQLAQIAHFAVEFPAETLRDDTRFHLDLWREGRDSWDIHVPAAEVDRFKAWLSEHGLQYSVNIANVQQLVDAERTQLRSMVSLGDNSDDFHASYHTLDEINEYVANIAKAYPSLVKMFEIGQSFENRSIYAVEITSPAKTSIVSGKLTDDGAKPGIFYNGGQHAREWIGPASMCYLIDQLTSQYDKDDTITKMLDDFVWTIVPVVNVDGFVYTHTDNRMWRKTRSINPQSACVGVDPNRNWDYEWCGAGTSDNPCSDIFCGLSAASEPEVQALQKYLTSHTNLHGYIDFHSYSQLWMGPWGYTSDEPKDVGVQNDLAEKATDALRKVHNKRFNYGPIATTIYPASGNSADFAYGTAKITFSYGVELRDTGEYGFVLPADQIRPQGEELLAAVQSMAGSIAQWLSQF